MTAAADRRKALEILAAAVAAGARAREVAALLDVGLTTLQCWRRQFAGVGDGLDRRKGCHLVVSHRLSEEERQRILLTCNEPEYAALPPGQIVPILADRGLYIGSERTFYRGPLCPRPGPPSWSCPSAPRTPSGSAGGGQSPKSGMQLGHHLSAHQRPWCLALALSGDRRLEPQSGGLGCGRTGRGPDRR